MAIFFTNSTAIRMLESSSFGALECRNSLKLNQMSDKHKDVNITSSHQNLYLVDDGSNFYVHMNTKLVCPRCAGFKICVQIYDTASPPIPNKSNGFEKSKG